jgi:large subunit ribosomal protein L23
MAKAINLYDILVRPVVTEKSNIASADQNQFTFEVAINANKIQIKEAVEIIFDVDVVKVSTMVMPPKRARRGRRIYVRKKAWKKAVVKLAPGQNIDLFNP